MYLTISDGRALLEYIEQYNTFEEGKIWQWMTRKEKYRAKRLLKHGLITNSEHEDGYVYYYFDSDLIDASNTYRKIVADFLRLSYTVFGIEDKELSESFRLIGDDNFEIVFDSFHFLITLNSPPNIKYNAIYVKYNSRLHRIYVEDVFEEKIPCKVKCFESGRSYYTSYQ